MWADNGRTDPLVVEIVVSESGKSVGFGFSDEQPQLIPDNLKRARDGIQKTMRGKSVRGLQVNRNL